MSEVDFHFLDRTGSERRFCASRFQLATDFRVFTEAEPDGWLSIVDVAPLPAELVAGLLPLPRFAPGQFSEPGAELVALLDGAELVRSCQGFGIERVEENLWSNGTSFVDYLLELESGRRFAFADWASGGWCNLDRSATAARIELASALQVDGPRILVPKRRGRASVLAG